MLATVFAALAISAAPANVVDCNSWASYPNIKISSARNMTCRAAVLEMRRYRGSDLPPLPHSRRLHLLPRLGRPVRRTMAVRARDTEPSALTSATRATLQTTPPSCSSPTSRVRFDYYTQKLGFEGHALGEESRALRLRLARRLPTSTSPAFTAPPAAEQPGRPAGHVRPLRLRRRRRELHEEFVERGADIVFAPLDTDYGLREIRVRDPSGYILAFGTLPE